MKNIILTQISIEEFHSIIREVIQKEIRLLDHSKKQDELLTRNDVRALFKINLSTLWTWQKQGKIPYYSVGNRIYFKRSDVDKILIKIN